MSKRRLADAQAELVNQKSTGIQQLRRIPVVAGGYNLPIAPTIPFEIPLVESLILRAKLLKALGSRKGNVEMAKRKKETDGSLPFSQRVSVGLQFAG